MSSKKTDNADSTMPTNQLEAQAQGVKRFFASGTFSDLVIACKGQEWEVHKTQVCAQSEFFYKACTTKFKEASDNKIELDGDDPQVVEAMLHYMYHGAYSDAGNATTDLATIILDVKMFTIADKYFINPLKTVACTKFAEHCESEWKTEGFARAVQELYESGIEDRRLKDVVIASVRANAKEMVVNKDDYPGISRAMRETPDFGADVVAELATASNGVATTFDHGSDDVQEVKIWSRWTFKCPNCNCTFCIDVAVGGSVTFSCRQGHYKEEFARWLKHKIGAKHCCRRGKRNGIIDSLSMSVKIQAA